MSKKKRDSSQISIEDRYEEVRQLITLGKDRGYLAIEEINEMLPDDLTSRPEEIEEERRLLYVAMSRARDHLHLVQPLRFLVRQQHRHGDAHVFAPRSRFLPDEVLDRFDRQHYGDVEEPSAPERAAPVRVDMASRLRGMWT